MGSTEVKRHNVQGIYVWFCDSQDAPSTTTDMDDNELPKKYNGWNIAILPSTQGGVEQEICMSVAEKLKALLNDAGFVARVFAGSDYSNKQGADDFEEQWIQSGKFKKDKTRAVSIHCDSVGPADGVLGCYQPTVKDSPEACPEYSWCKAFVSEFMEAMKIRGRTTADRGLQDRYPGEFKWTEDDPRDPNDGDGIYVLKVPKKNGVLGLLIEIANYETDLVAREKDWQGDSAWSLLRAICDTLGINNGSGVTEVDTIEYSIRAEHVGELTNRYEPRMPASLSGGSIRIDNCWQLDSTKEGIPGAVFSVREGNSHVTNGSIVATPKSQSSTIRNTGSRVAIVSCITLRDSIRRYLSLWMDRVMRALEAIEILNTIDSGKAELDWKALML